MDGEAEGPGKYDEYVPDREPDVVRKKSPEEQADFDHRWGLDKPPWTTAARGPRGIYDDDKHYYDDAHREDMVRDLNDVEDAERRHLETEERQGLIGQGSLSTGHIERYLDWAKQKGHDPDDLRTLHSYQKEPGVGRATADHIADEYHLEGDDWRDKARHYGSLSDGSTTDGKIIGACPGCKNPLRRHDTAHGEEIRHLHNNHIRCHGGIADAVPEVAAADAVGNGLHGVEDSLEKAPDEWAYRAESVLHFADYLGRPDANNPTGKGPDEYKARTWDAYPHTRPMQSVEDRNINTPVLPSEPIKTRNINTPTPGLRGREDDVSRDEDEDDDED